MSFFHTVNSMPIGFRKHFLDLNKHKALEFCPISESEFRFNFNINSSLNPFALHSLKTYREQGFSACTSAYTWMQALASGPKVFKIDSRKWEALEQYKLTVKSEEYHQPYPTVIFDFPDDYTINRIIPFDWIDYSKESKLGKVMLKMSREMQGLAEQQIAELIDKEDMQSKILERFHKMYPGSTYEDFNAERLLFLDMMGKPTEQKPDFVIMHHNKDASWVMVNIMMNSGVSIAYNLKLAPGKFLEDCWDKENRLENIDKVCQDLSVQERDLSNKIIRACLNANLLLTHFGARKVGPASQSLYDQLNKFCSRKTKASDVVKENNRIALRTLPILYEFEQHIKLHTEETIRQRSEPGEPTGRIVRPHWRSGHYRRQHYGVGNILTKVIPIPPVFINSELFLGNKADTKVEYR